MSEVFFASSQKSVKCLATVDVFEISDWAADDMTKCFRKCFSRIKRIIIIIIINYYFIKYVFM